MRTTIIDENNDQRRERREPMRTTIIDENNDHRREPTITNDHRQTDERRNPF